jgi:AmmeMemoRadiSam system protein B
MPGAGEPGPDPAPRPPAAAGRFYPADPAVLAASVDHLLDAVVVPAAERLAAAYVVPHAGYRYSGPTAAKVYARLRAHAAEVSRVVVLGPAHHVWLRGCAVPRNRRWSTPLGPVAVDPAAGMLSAVGYAVADDAPHRLEHSIEVQLPLLQRSIGPVPVLPVLVGTATPTAVADLVAATVSAAGLGTVVLCSTDLSHYLPDGQARQRDRRTVAAMLDVDPDRIAADDACGACALRGLLAHARRAALRPRLLDLATSADTGGDRSSVVGYAAVAFALR